MLPHSSPAGLDEAKAREDFLVFFEDMYVELSKFGKLEDAVGGYALLLRKESSVKINTSWFQFLLRWLDIFIFSVVLSVRMIIHLILVTTLLLNSNAMYIL